MFYFFFFRNPRQVSFENGRFLSKGRNAMRNERCVWQHGRGIGQITWARNNENGCVSPHLIATRKYNIFTDFHTSGLAMSALTQVKCATYLNAICNTHPTLALLPRHQWQPLPLHRRLLTSPNLPRRNLQWHNGTRLATPLVQSNQPPVLLVILIIRFPNIMLPS